MYSIYKITNKVNGKIYIGYTENTIENRFRDHCAEALRGKRYTRPILRAIKKYGPDSFTIEALYEGTNKEYTLNDREDYYIETYKNIVGWDNMYNICPGGLGGDRSMSPAYQNYIQNRPRRFGKDNHFYGMSHTEETKQKISKARKGKGTGPKNHGDKIKAFWADKVHANKGKDPWNKGKSGVQDKRTPEQMASFSKRVIFEEIEYPSLEAASRATGLSPYKIKKRGQVV